MKAFPHSQSMEETTPLFCQEGFVSLRQGLEAYGKEDRGTEGHVPQPGVPAKIDLGSPEKDARVTALHVADQPPNLSPRVPS